MPANRVQNLERPPGDQHRVSPRRRRYERLVETVAESTRKQAAPRLTARCGALPSQSAQSLDSLRTPVTALVCDTGNKKTRPTRSRVPDCRPRKRLTGRIGLIPLVQPGCLHDHDSLPCRLLC
jgi:hypothetical protein